jgi:hypothetical protein
MQEVADASGCASISRTGPRIAGMTETRSPAVAHHEFSISFFSLPFLKL